MSGLPLARTATIRRVLAQHLHRAPRTDCRDAVSARIAMEARAVPIWPSPPMQPISTRCPCLARLNALQIACAVAAESAGRPQSSHSVTSAFHVGRHLAIASPLGQQRVWRRSRCTGAEREPGRPLVGSDGTFTARTCGGSIAYSRSRGLWETRIRPGWTTTKLPASFSPHCRIRRETTIAASVRTLKENG